MPLQWRRDHNPYLHNPFGILGVGPNTPPDHIAAVAEQLARRAKVGQPPRLAGQPLGPHQIREARNRLLDDRTRAPELLLAHPEAQQVHKPIQRLAAGLKQAAVLPQSDEPPPLLHPAAIFSLVPCPEPDAAQWPALDDIGLVEPGDPEDLALDIVFDS